MFWYNGSAVEYASSGDASSWTSRGTLPYNTPNFSVAFKRLAGTSYIFVVAEANTYDVVMRRGGVQATSISFDGEDTVLDGSAVGDRYLLPSVSLDANGKVWTSALKDMGDRGDRSHLAFRRTQGHVEQSISFDSISLVGKPAARVSRVAMVPTSADKMLAVVSGESGANVISYTFDGASWSFTGAGGEYGRIRFAEGDLNDQVNALTIDSSGAMYVGGEFTTASGQTVNRVAKWDGNSWSPLGAGVDGVVYALTTDAHGNLYAGGNFNTAGGVSASRVAKWDGRSWSPLAAGTSGSVRALTVDAGGALYVGGSFTTAGGISANRIAKWDGTSWSALGEGTNATVYALTLDAAGALFVGGCFTTAGGLSASRIAKWDGTSWAPLGTGISSGAVNSTYVATIAIDAAGNLYAGGWFTVAGGVAGRNRVAKWDGTSWSALGTGLNGFVYALAVDAAGNLYSGGTFTTAGGISARRIAKWDGASWSRLGPDSVTNHQVNALAVDAGGNLRVGGDLYVLGGSQTGYVATWNGSSWSGWAGGILGEVSALVRDSSGNLYAGGPFRMRSGAIGDAEIANISKWDGTSWSALGTGLNSYVYALAIDGGGNLYAGGTFSTAGGLSANNIAKWDGVSWSALGSGLNGIVRTLAVDAAGAVYAGGEFSTAGGVAAHGIAKWDGTSWTAVGTNVTSGSYVVSLAIGTGGGIYAAGSLKLSGVTGNAAVARWDGTSWTRIDPGFSTVYALVADPSGNVYAGGLTIAAGGVTYNGIAKWDGSAWSPLGGGLSVKPYVEALASDAAGNIYAAQSKFWIGTEPTVLSMWNGASWSAMEDEWVSTRVILPDSGDRFFVVEGSSASGKTRAGVLRRVAVHNQREYAAASLVPGVGGAHLFYIDKNDDIKMKSYSEDTGTWSAATTVRTGAVTSLAAGFYGPTSRLAVWFIEDGSVSYTEATAPYTTWSSPTTVSSGGAPMDICVHESSGTADRLVATWNRVGGSPGEVVTSSSGSTPTPTPSPTPTSSPTATVSPTPTATPTLAAPPPPDIGRADGAEPLVFTNDAVINGTGVPGLEVVLFVNEFEAARVKVSASGGWTARLPRLRVGRHEVTAYSVTPQGDRSAKVSSLAIIIVDNAPLDFTRGGKTEVTAWKRLASGVRFKLRGVNDFQWRTIDIAGIYPVPADYDDDGVTDIAAVDEREGELLWNIRSSITGAVSKVSLGRRGDTVISGCKLHSSSKYSLVVFKRRSRVVVTRELGRTATQSARLRGVRNSDLIGCADTNDDGIDEVLFKVPSTRKRSSRVLGFDRAGRVTLSRRVPNFVRGYTVIGGSGNPPLVALLGGRSRKGRLLRVEAMAGTFSFPMFYIEGAVTISMGTFGDTPTEQNAGILWAEHKTRKVFLRKLSTGSRIRPLFRMPRRYALLRPSNIVATGKGE